MGLPVDTVIGVPGVYRQPAVAAAGFPRLRTDVVGFVGVAGPNQIGAAMRLDDWRSYEETYLRDVAGNTIDPPLGAQLRDCVRAYFANGGQVCWVVNVAAAIDESQKIELLDAMLGWSAHTGLELLLDHKEVAIAVVPELEAWIATPITATFQAPIANNRCFQPCCNVHAGPPTTTTGAAIQAALFAPAEVLEAQRAFIDRIGRDKWRVFALVTVPAGLSPTQVAAWRSALAANQANADAAALYWPWLMCADKPGDVPTLQPPLGCVAGIFAKRDLQRGPHVAPANESLISASDVERAVTDEEHAKLNGAGVNVVRPFPNQGLQLWGARTLAYGQPVSDIGELGYVPCRRCLTAIERTADFIGQRFVFEPNLPMTRFVLAQTMTRYLLEAYKKGAFQGTTPETSFYVTCDATNNPPQGIELGQLVCEIGVALAAPAEFIVFRVGRSEGVVEIQEGA